MNELTKRLRELNRIPDDLEFSDIEMLEMYNNRMESSLSTARFRASELEEAAALDFDLMKGYKKKLKKAEEEIRRLTDLYSYDVDADTEFNAKRKPFEERVKELIER